MPLTTDSPAASPRPRGAASTEAAIREALFALTAERRYATIRVADLLARAGIGKSTFYDHFDGKDDALAAAMRPILLALATAASGRAAHGHVRGIVAHLWERRSAARPIFDSPAARIVERRLAEAIAAHGTGRRDAPPPLDAVGVAAAQVAMLRAWLTGRAGVTVDAMTDRLIACARLRDGARTEPAT